LEVLYTAISIIKVVDEKSGKVEYVRERLLGIVNKLMNFQSDSQQPFALVFDFSALLVDNLIKLTEIAVYNHTIAKCCIVHMISLQKLHSVCFSAIVTNTHQWKFFVGKTVAVATLLASFMAGRYRQE
jgi:hypothetical protein